MAKKDKTIKTAAIVGVGALALWWFLGKNDQTKIGQVIIDTQTKKYYVYGNDLKIHEVLEPEILSSDQVYNSIQVNTSQLSKYEQGVAFICL